MKDQILPFKALKRVIVVLVTILLGLEDSRESELGGDHGRGSHAVTHFLNVQFCSPDS